MQVVFWLSALGAAYLLGGYAALLWLAARLRPRPWRRAPITPAVSVIIAAYNEAQHIRARVENCLAQDYPADRLEVIVTSDGSIDGTDAIVAGFSDPRVRLVPCPERGGKLAALNRAVPHARGEVLVFSDANSEFQPQAVARLVASLADEQVGCVAGRKVIRSAGRPAEDEAGYWNYEHFVKWHESRLHSVIGADGSIYALRRGLYPFPRTDVGYMDDYYISLSVILRGQRIVYEPGATIAEAAGSSLRGEFRRKIRTLSGGLEVLRALWPLLVPGRSPVWWQVWSHRLLRFALPYLLLALLLSSAALAPGSVFYAAVFWAQAAAFLLALAEWAGLRSRPGRWAFRLTLMNYVLVPALLRFLLRRTQPVWEREGR